MAALTGGCLCGAIRYTISAPVTALRACHCRNCPWCAPAPSTTPTA